jgi:hypothetical protein
MSKTQDDNNHNYDENEETISILDRLSIDTSSDKSTQPLNIQQI